MSKTLYGHHIETIKGEDYVLHKDYTELQDKLESIINQLEELDDKLFATWQETYDHDQLTRFKCEDMLFLIEQVKKDIKKILKGDNK